jgi:hypothetical protein
MTRSDAAPQPAGRLRGGIKLAIYQSMRDQGVKKSELARRLGWHMPQIDRQLDLHHASRLDQAVAVAVAVAGRDGRRSAQGLLAVRRDTALGR